MAKEIKIGLVGDFCLHQIKNRSMKHQVNSLKFCRDLNSKVDLSIANHEFTVLEREEDVKWMSVSAQDAENIADGGFDVFCLANNHIGDYGHDGMLHTQLFLEKRGHKTVGIGRTVEEAYQPLFVEKNGYRIAIVNYSDATQYAASRNKPGLAKVKKSLMRKAIRNAKRDADLVVVQIHADLEFTNYPAPWRVGLARNLAKLGPDMIIQHHPHCLQGIEKIGNTLIAYSLGNFIFSAFGNPYGENRPGHCNESVYLTVAIKEGDDGIRNIDYELTPVMINENNVTYIPTPEKSREILDKMNRYSAALKNGSKLRKHFFDLCCTEMSTLITDTYYRTAKKGPIEGFKFFVKHFKTAAHTNWIRGFFTLGKF